MYVNKVKVYAYKNQMSFVRPGISKQRKLSRMSHLKFKPGDRVVYHPTGAGNESIGTIKEIVEEPPLPNLPNEDYPRYVHTRLYVSR